MMLCLFVYTLHCTFQSSTETLWQKRREQKISQLDSFFSYVTHNNATTGISSQNITQMCSCSLSFLWPSTTQTFLFNDGGLQVSPVSHRTPMHEVRCSLAVRKTATLCFLAFLPTFKATIGSLESPLWRRTGSSFLHARLKRIRKSGLQHFKLSSKDQCCHKSMQVNWGSWSLFFELWFDCFCLLNLSEIFFPSSPQWRHILNTNHDFQCSWRAVGASHSRRPSKNWKVTEKIQKVRQLVRPNYTSSTGHPAEPHLHYILDCFLLGVISHS